MFEIRTMEKIGEKTDRERKLDRLYKELADTIFSNSSKRKRILNEISKLQKEEKEVFNPDKRIIIF